MEVASDKLAAVEDGAAAAGVAEPPAEHLFVLPGTDWALWRTVCLRGAGFPAAGLLGLATPGCAAAADRLLDAEEAAELARGAALAAVNARLDALRRTAQWEDKGRREPLVAALQSLKMGKPPRPLEGEDLFNKHLTAWLDARARLKAEEEGFGEALRASAPRLTRAVREAMADPMFREALLWQNRTAYRFVRDALDRVGDEAVGRNSKQRQYEEMVASYLQRYCAKNDTIGFFGPVGWATLGGEVRGGISAAPGPRLLERREVYFEGWCLDALADSIAANGEARRWAAPRRLPYIRVEGNAVHLPASTRPTTLPAKAADVLRECDGTRTAADIAARLVRGAAHGLRGEEEVYQLLGSLRDRGLIKWTFEIPLAPHPEQALRGLLEKIEPRPLRATALAALSEVERARSEVALAAGDPERLDEALGALESTFTRLTGEAPRRAEGQTYAARTLVYEDGRRDIRVELGREILDELAPPLSLMLTSARWVAGRIEELYREALAETYESLRRRLGTPAVDAVTFWLAAQPLLFGAAGRRPIDRIPALLQERWERALSVPQDGRRRVEYTSAELRPRVLAAFDEPAPTWKQACHHSPDVMIAASSVEAINRGDFLFVLGEMHLASNTLGASLFVAQHPAPEDLLRFATSDFGGPHVSMIVPKSWPNQTLRTVHVLTPAHDQLVAVMHDSICPPGHEAVPVGELLVEGAGGDLLMRTRDGRVRFDLLDALGGALSLLAVNSFRVAPPAPHSPRLTVDRLVISRESWSFPAEELDFAFEKDEAGRFLAARRWARSQGLPRFAFLKSPAEVKPVYVDFASTIYVGMAAKLIRRTAEQVGAAVTFSEMLPCADQTWLPDAEGRTYTSEFRLVAVDLKARERSRGGALQTVERGSDR
jgi:hypothetical protein